MSDEKKMYRLTLDLSEKQVEAVVEALWRYAAIASGEFEYVGYLYRDQLRVRYPDNREVERRFEHFQDMARMLLCPWLKNDAKYSLSDPRVDRDSKLAHQVYQVLYSSFHRMGQGDMPPRRWSNHDIDEPRPIATFIPLPPCTKPQTPSSGPRPNGPG